MARYHISEDGQARICNAQSEETCRAKNSSGEPSPHITTDNPIVLERFQEEQNKNNYGAFKSLKKEQSKKSLSYSEIKESFSSIRSEVDKVLRNDETFEKRAFTSNKLDSYLNDLNKYSASVKSEMSERRNRAESEKLDLNDDNVVEYLNEPYSVLEKVEETKNKLYDLKFSMNERFMSAQEK